MKYCPGCGANIEDDARFCPKCGRKLKVYQRNTEFNRKRTESNLNGLKPNKLITILSVLIGVLLVSCIILGLLLLSDMKKKKGNEQFSEANQDANSDTESSEVIEEDIRNAYIDYFYTNIAATGALDDCERKEAVLTSDNYRTSAAEWYVCSGVIGMDLADLDYNGQNEMIVYYIDTKTAVVYDEQRKVSYLYADIYSIGISNEVEKVGTVQLSGDILGIETSVEKVGIAEVNGKEYLYHYEYLSSIFGNGTCGYYELYMIENGVVRRAYVLGQAVIGSAELEFIVQTYTDLDSYSTVCCARDQFAHDDHGDELPLSSDYLIFDYENRYDCDLACWKQLGVEYSAPHDSISDGADFWNTDMVKGGYSYNISSSSVEYGENGQKAYMYSEIENRSEYKPVIQDGEVEKKDPDVSEKDAYKEIIEQYQEVLNDQIDDNKINRLRSVYPLLNWNLIQETAIDQYGLSYCRLDINADGNDELLISDWYNTAEDNTGFFYAIYTQKEDEVIPLINDCSYRTYCYLCEDGTIVVSASGGALHGSKTLYRINENADGLTLISEYEMDYEKDSYAPYYNGEERLTEEEFDAKYRAAEPAMFEWTDFN